MSGIKNPVISSIVASAFPISGLSATTAQALRLFVPSPSYCFSNTAGTTRAVQDGPVARWNEATGKPLFASQATAGFQPRLRRGAKNWLPNSTMQGTVSGSPGTLPTGTRGILRAGLTRTITSTTEVINGVSTPVLYVRFQGTSTDSGDFGFDWNTGVSIGAWIGQRWCYSVSQRLVTGTLPSGWNIQIVGITGGSAVSELYQTSLSLTSTWQRFSFSSIFTNANTVAVTAQNRVSVPTGTPVDVTIAFAMPQLELGVSSPSAYAPTFGAPASNGVGNWWLDFDSIQTRLELSERLFDGINRGFCSVAIEPTLRTFGAILWNGNTATNTEYSNILYSTISTPPGVYGSYRNDSGTGNIPSSPLGSTLGVYSSAEIGSNAIWRRNRTQIVTLPMIPRPITINSSTIGAARRNGTTDLFYDGKLFGLATANTEVTTQQLSNIESYLAYVGGVSL